MTRALGFAIALLCGCADDGAVLLVDLKTDLAPGTEFDVVRIDLVRGTRPVGLDTARPGAGATFLDGERVSELDGLERGAHTLLVTLELGGRSVVTRERTVDVRAETNLVVVVITRGCLRDPDGCVEEECTTAADCPAVADCAVARCVDGACLAVLEGTPCAAGQLCDPVMGCITPEIPDAGIEMDAGPEPGEDGGPAVCAPDTADCNDRADDGCETSLTTLTDCGSCGTRCELPRASETCATGRCRITGCDPGFLDCNASAPDGCETRADDDPNHCGMCGMRCALPHASPLCMGGTCATTFCEPMWADCNGAPLDGCETPLNTLSNCGRCGAGCMPAHATATCSSGMCMVASCQAGFADCNGFVGDGCETDSSSSPIHCGRCGAACGVGEICMDGRCECGVDGGSVGGGPVCTGGQSCCGGVGCRMLETDVTNCGTCGNRCGARETCMGGDCCCGLCRMTGEACVGSTPTCNTSGTSCI